MTSPFPQPQPMLSANTLAFESQPMVKPTGFREYDARWLFEKEINLMGVQALGMGLGTLLHRMGVKPEIVVGHDFRSYSASIKLALTTWADGRLVWPCTTSASRFRRGLISRSSRWIFPPLPLSRPRTTTTAGPASRWAHNGR